MSLCERLRRLVGEDPLIATVDGVNENRQPHRNQHGKSEIVSEFHGKVSPEILQRRRWSEVFCIGLDQGSLEAPESCYQ